MTAYVSHTTIGCRNAYELAEWWKQDPESGHRLLFIEVPEEKQGKNRIHLDLCSREGSRDDELTTLLALGATEVADLRGKYGPGTGWVVLADPEGNEFCIVRSRDETGAG